MKIIHKKDKEYFIRFDRGEDVVEVFKQFCLEQKFQGGAFTAIGAAEYLILSFYNLETKEYEDHDIDEEVEILGVTGSVSYKDDEVVMHAHGSFGKRDLSVIGGHVKKMVVSATCEMHLQVFDTKMVREFDGETGLYLLK